MTDRKSLRDVKVGTRLTNKPTPKEALTRKEFDKFIEQDTTLRKAEARLVLHIYAGTLTYNSNDKKKESWLSQKSVAAKAGLNKDTVSGYVKALVQAGYLIPGNEYKATAYHVSQGYFLGKGNAEGFTGDRKSRIPSLQTAKRVNTNSDERMQQLNAIRKSNAKGNSGSTGRGNAQASPVVPEQPKSGSTGMAHGSKSGSTGEVLSGSTGEVLSGSTGAKNKVEHQGGSNNSTPPADSSLPADAVRSESDASLDSACGADRHDHPLIQKNDVDLPLIAESNGDAAHDTNIEETGNSGTTGMAVDDDEWVPDRKMNDEQLAARIKTLESTDTSDMIGLQKLALKNLIKSAKSEQAKREADDDDFWS